MPVRFFRQIDWVLLLSVVPIILAGLVTMNTFEANNYFFIRQLVWVSISVVVFFGMSAIDWRFLKYSNSGFYTYLALLALLLALFLGTAINGARSWILLPGFSLQPGDFMKIVLIVLLAKYFSRRHIEIARLRHIIVSGLYALVPFILIAAQPDLGTAAIIFFIWLGLVVVSGIPIRYLALVGTIVLVVVALAWQFGLGDYQKDRVLIFIDPLRDPQGAGYNAIQSQIAVGSGQVIGKGVGFGTQSRLEFLPELETDFIFAAFAEEWGFVGVGILLALYAVIFIRLTQAALAGASNFESLFIMGYALFLFGHVLVNVGMNVGLMPITGIPLPFMSYGGSHLLVEFTGLGMVMGMRRYARATVHNAEHEFIASHS
ncbi:MAG: rod shape-determining protein RodA [bacterium]|nr:rod shape-determining protein RodA [bacterium]